MGDQGFTRIGEGEDPWATYNGIEWQFTSVPPKTEEGRQVYDAHRQLFSGLLTKKDWLNATIPKVVEEARDRRIPATQRIFNLSQAIPKLRKETEEKKWVGKLLAPLAATDVRIVGDEREGLFCLLPTRNNEIWMALIDRFGDLSKPDVVFTKDQDLWPELSRGKPVDDMVLEATGFQSDGDMTDKAHKQVLSIASSKKIGHDNLDEWKNVVEAMVIEEQIDVDSINLFAKMSKTNPEHVVGWHEHGLSLNMYSACWVASNCSLGSRWVARVDEQPTKKSREDDIALLSPAKSQVSFTEPEAGLETTIVKASKKKNKNIMDFFATTRSKPELPVRRNALVFSHRTFLQVYIPIVVTDSKMYGQFQTQFIKAFRDVAGSVINVAGTSMLPFRLVDDYNEREVINNKDEIPSNYRELTPRYVPSLTMKWSNSHFTDASFLIGHEKELSAILGSDRVADAKLRHQAILEKDPLQCKSRACAKVLLGPLPLLEQTLRDLAQQITCHPIAVRLGITAVELKIELFRLGKVMNADKLRVRVIHVYVDVKILAAACRALKKIYSSKPKPRSNYPMGKQYRAFLLADQIFTDYDVAVGKNLRTKVKRFQGDSMTEKYEHIKSIYRPSPIDPNVSLACLLLALKATARKGKLLFLALEQEYDNSPVIFHYHCITHQQAHQTITTLPLVISQMFGKPVADAWFNAEAWYDLDKFSSEFVDPDDVNQGVRIKRAALEDWEETDSDFELNDLEDVNPEDSEIIISNFDLVKLETEAGHQIGDDTGSTWSYPTSPFDVDDEEDDAKPAAVEMADGKESIDDKVDSEVEAQGLSQGTEDTSSLTASIKGHSLLELVDSELSADEKVERIKNLLGGAT